MSLPKQKYNTIHHSPGKSGFTLIELLVVIAIIGLLASVVLLSLGSARQRGRVAKAKADVKQVVTAIDIIYNDTGKFPGGCPREDTGGYELPLNNPNAGLLVLPSVGTVSGNCAWTVSEVANWKGPYIGAPDLIDPWGFAYYFDQDYHDPTDYSVVYPAVVSWGDDSTINDYDQDNISVRLK